MSDRSVAARRLAARLVALALALHFAVALAELAPLARLAVSLTRLDFAARGELAADERRAPLATSGQVRYRRRIAEEARAGRRGRSAVAYSWSFLWRTRGELVAADRIVVDPPETIPYFYATFLWFPVPVEVGPSPGVVRDEASIAALRLELPSGKARAVRLAELGYTRRLVAGRRGLTLERLPAPVQDGGAP